MMLLVSLAKIDCIILLVVLVHGCFLWLCAVNRNLESIQYSYFDHKLREISMIGVHVGSFTFNLSAPLRALNVTFSCPTTRRTEPVNLLTASTAPEYSPRKTAEHPPLTPSNMQPLYCAGGHVYNNFPLPPSPSCLLYSHTLFSGLHTHIWPGGKLSPNIPTEANLHPFRGL